MKKIKIYIRCFLLFLLASGIFAVNAANGGFSFAASVADGEYSVADASLRAPKNSATGDSADMGFASKSAYLVDFNTGTELYSKNAEQKLTIASMVKIMTLLLSFEAIDKGQISLDADVHVSENAAGMGGSQVFLDADSVHSVRKLLKAITVCSANDASVAMAETVSGSEEIFVAAMNRRAKELGMENTVFVNCTGLPKAGQHSTAKDVSKMYRQLLRHREYFEFTRVWMEDYVHPDGRKTEMTNTNKLIRFYKGCDSGKTGFTSESLYCLSASAVNGNMRVISVVMGAESSPKRFDDAKKLFNYAFANYENKKLVSAGEAVADSIKVKGGKAAALRAAPTDDVFALNKKGGGAKFTVEYELPPEVKASVTKGQVIGKAIVKKDGVKIAECAIASLDDVGRAGVLDNIKKIISKW
ncbi:MAG: D-alanyl-D-alanine carboxypeptidase [Clostridiales bacterium]|jgi:D-alanyl-D-alanine carboxypeptidase (penicillin-binding protein 5/6)|nr:D-alanyl-D-alanine carboxypeptidase [Clostridiales bacterium]